MYLSRSIVAFLPKTCFKASGRIADLLAVSFLYRVVRMPYSKMMKFYSAWSIALALVMLIYLFYVYFSEPVEGAEAIYAMCVALFHMIYGIWFYKGRDTSVFAARTIQGRTVYGVFLLVVAACTKLFHGIQLPETVWLDRVYYYALVVGSVELFSALITKVTLYKSDYKARQKTASKMTFKSKNRFVFGIYLLFIGFWNLISPNTLLSFLYLPETAFSGFLGDVISLGPMHILGVQILILGSYNLFAARNNLETLVEAGMRGGAITVIFFVVLVATGFLHPITLLLPAIDFVSIILIVIDNQLERSAKSKFNISSR